MRDTALPLFLGVRGEKWTVTDTQTGDMKEKMEEYEPISTLHSGFTSTVTLVQTQHPPHKKYIFKTVDLTKMTKSEIQNVEQEVKLLRTIKHPNIIHYKVGSHHIN